MLDSRWSDSANKAGLELTPWAFLRLVVAQVLRLAIVLAASACAGFSDEPAAGGCRPAIILAIWVVVAAFLARSRLDLVACAIGTGVFSAVWALGGFSVTVWGFFGAFVAALAVVQAMRYSRPAAVTYAAIAIRC